MPSTEKIDREADAVMRDRRIVFLLYAVATGLCWCISDFSMHFEGSVEEEAKKLITVGFLKKSDGRLGVMERGRFVLGDLADEGVRPKRVGQA